MPPRAARQGSISRVHHRYPHLPPTAAPPPLPPTASSTSTVMNEIRALEAFGRDTRVRTAISALAEELGRNKDYAFRPIYSQNMISNYSVNHGGRQNSICTI